MNILTTCIATIVLESANINTCIIETEDLESVPVVSFIKNGDYDPNYSLEGTYYSDFNRTVTLKSDTGTGEQYFIYEWDIAQ